MYLGGKSYPYRDIIWVEREKIQLTIAPSVFVNLEADTTTNGAVHASVMTVLIIVDAPLDWSDARRQRLVAAIVWPTLCEGYGPV